MRRSTLLALSLVVACADPPPPIADPESPPAQPGAMLPPSGGTGIAGGGPDQAPLPDDPPSEPATKQDDQKPLDPDAPAPKTGSSEKCNSAGSFSISEWKNIDATKKEVDFDVASSIEGEMQVLDHDTDVVIEADRSIAKDPLTGGQPEGSFRGISAVSGQRLLLRADWGDCLVVVVP